MIVKWFADFIAFLWEGMMDAIPDIPVPSWFTGSDSWFSTLFQEAGSMSVWVNFGLARTVGTILIGCIALSAAIKLGRILASFLTAGGGSAA